MKKPKGFTLIELLIVIGIIAILAAIVYVAVDPGKRLRAADDANRSASVNAVLNAILKFTVDNDGDLPTNLDGATVDLYYVLGTAASGCDAGCTAQATTQAACLDLTSDLVDSYLAEIPKDPDTGTDANTDYYIMKSTNGRITVGACDPEDLAKIEVKR